MRQHSHIHRAVGRLVPVLGLALGCFCLPLMGIVQVELTPSLLSPQPVGTIVTWTAAGTNSNPGVLTYRFEVLPPATLRYVLLRDFSAVNTFDWNPNYVEGKYRIRVTARDYQAGETAQKVVVFQVISRVTGGQATVTPTAHPLVALFSAPTCPAGSTMRVWFRRQGSSSVSATDWKPCHAGSMNFYVAGLLPNQTYDMNYQVLTGGSISSGPAALSFTTGIIPPSLSFPSTALLVPPTSQADIRARIVLTGYFLLDPPAFPVATDLLGNIVWYYPIYQSQLTRPLPGGTMLLIADGPGTSTGFWGEQTRQWILREIDLAGNTNRETNVDRVNEQLVALGTDYIGRFHHDAIRLPNGNTIVFGDVQRVFPSGTQGSTEPVDIIGLMIIFLDKDFQVIDHWSAFDHIQPTQLDINRQALRGETCSIAILGCPPALLPGFSSANDWLHANSIQYLPDGNLLVSLRNQDWVIKIDYQDGAGTRDVLWRLGKDGDFTMTGTADPYPWFSGQHDAAFEDSGMTVLSLFDNGHSRVLQYPGSNSRGQVLNVDEADRTVSLQLNVDLGVFSGLLGSAQRLSNGNYMFEAGYLNGITTIYQRSIEVTPSGSAAHMLQGAHSSYRGWRLADFYRPPGS